MWNSLDNVLTEFDEVSMKHKADIGKCKAANHLVEKEPRAIPHSGGAHRMSPEKTERAYQEVCILRASDRVQPS